MKHIWNFILTAGTICLLAAGAFLLWSTKDVLTDRRDSPSEVSSKGIINTTLQEGEQSFLLPDVDFEKDGLSAIVDTFRQYAGLPEKLGVAYLNAGLSGDGSLSDLTLTLEGYGQSEEYQGNYAFVYSTETKKLQYSVISKESQADSLANIYNPNYEYSYLSGQISRIPLREQMSALNFDYYHLKFIKNGTIQAGTPVLDTSLGAAIPVITSDLYNSGSYGAISDGTGLFIRFGDEVREVVYDAQIIDGTNVKGNPDYTMQYDYYIDQGKIKFTRDYGESWFAADIPESDVYGMLEFYHTSASMPEGSYYISEAPDGVTAFFYGKTPTLRISNDGGKTWFSSTLSGEFVRESSRRIVHFRDKLNGYAFAGTDFSMGTGSNFIYYTTQDGGVTWQSVEAEFHDSRVLSGAGFVDGDTGFVSLETSDMIWPSVYLTEDGGKTYREIKFPWEQIPAEVQFLNRVDSLTYENGVYRLVIGQGAYGTEQVIMLSSSLTEGWTYESHQKTVKHNVG